MIEEEVKKWKGGRARGWKEGGRWRRKGSKKEGMKDEEGEKME